MNLRESNEAAAILNHLASAEPAHVLATDELGGTRPGGDVPVSVAIVSGRLVERARRLLVEIGAEGADRYEGWPYVKPQP